MGDDGDFRTQIPPEPDLLRIDEGIQLCPACGKENPLGYYGCQWCGRTLSFHLGPEAHPVPTPRPGRRTRPVTELGLLDRRPWLRRLATWSPLLVIALLTAVVLLT